MKFDKDLHRIAFKTWLRSRTKAYQVTGLGISPKIKKMYRQTFNVITVTIYDLKTKEPEGEKDFSIFEIEEKLNKNKLKFI
jgi:hypothetical protein